MREGFAIKLGLTLCLLFLGIAILLLGALYLRKPHFEDVNHSWAVLDLYVGVALIAAALGKFWLDWRSAKRK